MKMTQDEEMKVPQLLVMDFYKKLNKINKVLLNPLFMTFSLNRQYMCFNFNGIYLWITSLKLFDTIFLASMR